MASPPAYAPARARRWSVAGAPRWATLALASAAAVAVVVSVVARPGEDPDQLARSAGAAIEARSWDRAEAALTRLARLRPATDDDLVLQARLAMARGRTVEALTALAGVPDDHPMAAWARLRQGQLELRRDRLRAAEAALLRALACDPKLIQPRRELLYICGVQLRRGELGAQFRALADRVPLTFDDMLLWCRVRGLNWEPPALAADLRRYVVADPEDRGSRLALAECLRQMARLDEAEATLGPLPAADPDARAARARLALDRGDLRRVDELLAAGPLDHPELARLRGRAALYRRDWTAAAHHFRDALAAEPDDREALAGLGRALELTRDAEAARPYLEAARAHDELNNLLRRAATSSARNDSKLLSDLGAACAALGFVAEARAWYHLAIDLDPLDGQAQAALHRLDQAPGPGAGADGAIATR